MRIFGSLIHGALFPRTRVYQDAQGKLIGTSTDVTPMLLLLGRMWGGMLWLYFIFTPLLAPVYFIFAHWYCRRYDSENMADNPDSWIEDKHNILKSHRNILIGWIIFMVWGYCVNWGQKDNTKESVPQITKEYNWDPATYVDPYKQYIDIQKGR